MHRNSLDLIEIKLQEESIVWFYGRTVIHKDVCEVLNYHRTIRLIKTENGEIIESYSPVDGKLIAKVKSSTQEDYEKAISLVDSCSIDADTVITDVSPLSEIQNAFESLDSSPTALKSLIKVGDLS